MTRRYGLVLAIVAAALLAGCQGMGWAGGSAGETGGHGRVKLGLPF